MARIVFNEVGQRVTASGICEVCGKRFTVSNYIYQTVNPFNKNEKGFQKSREEIEFENKRASEEWKSKQNRHQKCKY